MKTELEKYVMSGPSLGEAAAFFVGLKKQAKAPEPEEQVKEAQGPVQAAQLATARRVLETRKKDRPGTAKRTAGGAAGGAVGGAITGAGLAALTRAVSKGKIKLPTRTGAVFGSLTGAASGGAAGQYSGRKNVKKYKGLTARMAIGSARAVPLAIQRTMTTGQPSVIAISHKGKQIPVFAVGRRGKEKTSQAEFNPEEQRALAIQSLRDIAARHGLAGAQRFAAYSEEHKPSIATHAGLGAAIGAPTLGAAGYGLGRLAGRPGLGTAIGAGLGLLGGAGGGELVRRGKERGRQERVQAVMEGAPSMGARAVMGALRTGRPAVTSYESRTGERVPVSQAQFRPESRMSYLQALGAMPEQEPKSEGKKKAAAAFAVLAELSKIAEEESESLDSDLTVPSTPESPGGDYMEREPAGLEAEAGNAVQYYQQQLDQARQELAMAQEQAQQAQATAEQMQQAQAGHDTQLQAAQQEASIAEQAAMQNVQAAGQRATQAMNQALEAEERALQAKQESTQAQLAVQGMRGQLLDMAAQDPGLPGATPPPEAVNPTAPPAEGEAMPPQPGAEAPEAGLNQEGMPAEQEQAAPEGPPAAAGPAQPAAPGTPQQPSESPEKPDAEPNRKVDIKVSHVLGKALASGRRPVFGAA
jgi:hypothetical protein